MKYARLGSSGLIVSRLSLGTLSFGKGATGAGDLYKVDLPLAERLVATAIDRGVNYFNTADVYAEGQSEAMLGAALGERRKDVVVCTKLGLRNGSALIDRGLSRRHILGSVESSLRRLGTDWIDVLVLHCTDPHTPLDETLETLDQIVRSGQVRYIGVSNWPAWLTAKAVVRQREQGWAQFQTAEVYYNLLGREVEHEIVPMARDAGLTLQPWSPLAGGLLSGRHSVADLRSGAQPISNYAFLPIDRARAFAALDVLADIGNQVGASVGQVAMAWLLSKQTVATVIIGASRIEQLEDNLGASSVVLDAEAVGRLDAVTAPQAIYPAWYADAFVDPQIEAAFGDHGAAL